MFNLKDFENLILQKFNDEIVNINLLMQKDLGSHISREKQEKYYTAFCDAMIQAICSSVSVFTGFTQQKILSEHEEKPSEQIFTEYNKLKNNLYNSIQAVDFDTFLEASNQQKELFTEYFNLILELNCAKLEYSTLKDLQNRSKAVHNYVQTVTLNEFQMEASHRLAKEHETTLAGLSQQLAAVLKENK